MLPLREQIVSQALEDLDKIKQRAIANPLYPRDTARILARLGGIYLDANRVQDAGELYENAGALLEQYARDHPTEPVAARNLAAILNSQGDTALRLGNGTKARELYQKALDVRREWLRRLQLSNEPGASKAAIDAHVAIAMSHGLLGGVALKLGDPRTARRDYEEALQEYDGLPPEVGKQPPTRRNRAIQEAMLADAILKLGDTDDAERRLRSVLQQRKTFLKDAPRNRTAIRDLALSHLSLGDMLLIARNDPVAAWSECAEAHKAFVRLHEADKDDPGARRDLAMSLYHLGNTARRLEEAGVAPQATPGRATSQDYFAECLKLREALARIDPRDTQARIDWGLALARCGRAAEAEPIIDDFLKADPADPRLLFQAACGLALCSTSDDPELARRARDRAFAVLADLIRNGWTDAFTLRTDPDLEPIRGDDRFTLLPAAPGQPG